MVQASEKVTTIAEVAPFRPFDEAAALERLRSQPDGRTKLLPAELGQRWGWHALVVGRRLKAWQSAGIITRRGKVITAVD
jgi:hypothetical protein